MRFLLGKAVEKDSRVPGVLPARSSHRGHAAALKRRARQASLRDARWFSVCKWGNSRASSHCPLGCEIETGSAECRPVALTSLCEGYSFAPSGLGIFFASIPTLALWDACLRSFAAGFRLRSGQLVCKGHLIGSSVLSTNGARCEMGRPRKRYGSQHKGSGRGVSYPQPLKGRCCS